MGHIAISAVVAACISLIVPVEVRASCEPGGTPTYDDISGIAVRRGCGTDRFHYLAWARNDGLIFFAAKSETPVKGYYDGRDGRPLFVRLRQTLRDEDFLAVRLKPSPTVYFDGPCQTVEIMRCGVVIAVGGLSPGILPFEADTSDPQIRRFEAIVDKLQASIFAWPWQNEHPEVKPSPSPTPK
ncbi:MAG TPA: hypothetical protein VGF98_12600 [Candidatus Tumulicola sp.]|jgi:hypothetical protein